ncbi:hypothetical protein [Azospirillum halopraeferens]|uniref:hypothetical protein n=1 Tax=Azospirillum halopraeferens TaxID=34010 RepID=UPI00040928C9|nr:hypothetical protein [Azospirillum halopraeferens]
MPGDVRSSTPHRSAAARGAAAGATGRRCIRHALANLCAGIVATVATILAFIAAAESARPDDLRAGALALGLGLALCAIGAFRASRSDADAARALTGRALKDLP